jgi:soluble lytic murein transglycosylase-like protein
MRLIAAALSLEATEVVVDEATLRNETVYIITSHILNVNKNIKYETAERISLYIVDRSEQLDLDPFLLTSIYHVESTFNHKAISRGNYGIGQVNWRVHKSYLKNKFKGINDKKDLLKIENGIDASSIILKGYMDRNSDNVKKALNRYCPVSDVYYRKVIDVYNTLQNRYRLAHETLANRKLLEVLTKKASII